MKVYYTFEQFNKDLPSLKDVEINITTDFEKTIRLDTRQYQSVKEQIKKKNIKIKVVKKGDIYGN